MNLNKRKKEKKKKKREEKMRKRKKRLTLLRAEPVNTPKTVRSDFCA